MSFNEASQQVQNNTDVGAPRLRVNRTAPLTLNTTYQTLVFNGSSQYNLNSFPVLPGETMPSVWYDTATNLFKFSANVDRNYVLYLSTSITSSQLLSTLNLTSASLRFRLYIPAPTPITFPLPDFGGYIDLGPVNITGQRNDQQPVPFFANQVIRDYGFRIEICISASVLGTITLNGADVNLFRA